MTDEGRAPGAPVVVDLAAVLAGPPTGPDGALWSLPHGGDLDANVVRLGAGGRVGEHRNDEVDVLVVVIDGAGALTVDDRPVDVRAGVVVLVPRGSSRGVVAGRGGISYLSIHRRRGPLTIRSAG